MPVESIIQIICAIFSVILAAVAIGLSIWQFKKSNDLQKQIDKRDNDRYYENVNIEARKFITKYNETDEIQLLALCLVADLYDEVHPYNREIYKEWCALSDEVKSEILKLRKFDISYSSFFSKSDFFESSLKRLKTVLSTNYGETLYSNLFYDGAKYYIKCVNAYKNEKVYEVNKKKIIKKGALGVNVDMRVSDIIIDILSKQNIKYIYIASNGGVGQFDSSKEKIESYFKLDGDDSAGYICCLVALYGTIQSFADCTLIFENFGFIDDYAAKDDWHLEDLFLYSLLIINLYQEQNFVK